MIKGKEILSSGPYKVQYDDFYKTIFVRNNFWSNDDIRKAYPDKINLYYNQDSTYVANHLIQDVNKNAIIVDSINPKSDIKSLRSQAILNYTSDNRLLYKESPYVIYHFFNVKKINDLNIRKAIFYAMNHNLFEADSGDFSGYTAHDSIISPTLNLDYTPSTIGNDKDVNFKFSGNLVYAKQLLDLGKNSNPELYNRITDPKRGLIWITSILSQAEKYFYNSVVEYFKQINIYIVIKEVEDYYSYILNPNTDADILRSGWGADWNNASSVIPTLFLENGGWNVCKNSSDSEYNNIKQKINEALLESDRLKQADKWKALSQQIMGRYYAAKINYIKELVMCGSNIGNFSFNIVNGNCNLNNLYLKHK